MLNKTLSICACTIFMKIMQFPNKKECYHSIDFYVLFSCKARSQLLGMAEINSMEP